MSVEREKMRSQGEEEEEEAGGQRRGQDEEEKEEEGEGEGERRGGGGEGEGEEDDFSMMDVLEEIHLTWERGAYSSAVTNRWLIWQGTCCSGYIIAAVCHVC